MPSPKRSWAAFRVHTTLGPGLLESVYHAVLAFEVAQRGLRTASQQAVPVFYGTIWIDIGFRAALIKDGISRIVNGLEEDSHAKSQGRQEGQRNCGFRGLVGLRSIIGRA